MRYLVDIDGCLLPTDYCHIQAYAKVLGVTLNAMRLMYPAIQHLPTKKVLESKSAQVSKTAYALNEFIDLAYDPKSWPPSALYALKSMHRYGTVCICSNASKTRKLIVAAQIKALTGVQVQIIHDKEFYLLRCDDQDVVLDNDQRMLDIAKKAKLCVLVEATESSWVDALEEVPL